ncbi:MAG: hypothetical protein Q8M24_23085 [Pseudolabrys sp.]|nr:hypothetical protein [Pseudolabrys sp.]MDP2298338.1 hypothetical protein [Pseudolabrys sp.]
MNKITREHYPASKLPEDLRPSGNPNASVTITIEEEQSPAKVMTLEEIFSIGGFRRRTAAEIDADLKKLREEWDD